MITHLRTGLLMGMMTCAGLATTPAAAQDLGDAMDFVPGEAALVISTHNLKQTHARLSKWAKMLDITDAQQGLGMAQLFLANEGLNAEGAAVVVIPEVDEQQKSPEPIIILPVKDFEKFVFGLGGEAVEGVNVIEAPFGTIYAMNLGDGFAAVAQNEDGLEFVDARGGHIEDHMALVGRTGEQLSHDSDVMVVANVQSLSEFIEEGLDSMQDQMGMAAMAGMPPEQLEMATAMMTELSERLLRDGRSGLMGLNLAEGGLGIDFGANFAADSETAGYFQNEGNPSSFMAQMPSMPFLFAMAMDYSSAGIRSLITDVAAMAEDAGGGGGMMGGANFVHLLEESTGQAQLIGVTPGLFTGGLFANAISFTAAQNPDDLGDLLRGLYADMDGEVIGGIEFETSYEQAAVNVDGVDLDSWSIDMRVDPNDPNAMQAQQALQGQMMLMGGGGPQGYIAKSKTGLYQTMSRNSELVSKALKTNQGNSMASNDRIKAAAEHLPANRIMEGYLDVGEVINLVGSFAAMMGAEIPEIDAAMSPVAMAMTGDNGGMRFRTYVPADVITTIMGVIQDMQQDMGGAFEMEEEDAEPRF